MCQPLPAALAGELQYYFGVSVTALVATLFISMNKVIQLYFRLFLYGFFEKLSV